MQQKKILNIFIFAIISNVLASTSNLLIGGYAGMAICAVAVVQTAVSMIFELKHRKVPLPVTIFFLACYIGVSVLTYKTPLDILPCAAALMYALAMAQKKTLYLRLFMILNSVAWIVYELTLPTKNWAMAITFSIQLVATVIGLIRFDIKKKKEDTDEEKSTQEENGEEKNAEDSLS
jgi:hypothetical protein